MAKEKTGGEDAVSQARQEAEAILAAAREEAAKIIEYAKADAAQTVDTRAQERRPASPHPPGYWDERVPVYLFKDNGKYKDDVVVCVNGQAVKIQRGKQVMVKRKFAAVLEQSMAQDTATAELMDREARSFQRESERLGL